MARHKHLVPTDTATTHAYTSTDGGGSTREYKYPARSRGTHASKLKADLATAKGAAEQHVNAIGIEVKDIALEFASSQGFDLESNSLEDRRSKVELLSRREVDGKVYATVFVPEDKIDNFLKKIESYETEIEARSKDQSPKHKKLMESIDEIRLPVVRSFWTDAGDRYPQAPDEVIWWEVWLRVGLDNSDDQFATFVVEAERVGLQVSSQVVSFPERLVFLARGSESQWANSLALLGMLAELRRAKELPTDFVALPPRDQGAFSEDGAARITPPSEDAPAVCLMDTGVNAGHPLLSPVLSEDDLHVIHPEWNAADQNGHGTQMAGIATFGDQLAEHLAGNNPLAFAYRLESIKLLHPTIPHDPDNYGYVTVEGLAQVEQANPDRSRVACLSITSDDRDVGYPSLWSAAIDQHASGHDDDIRRFYVVAAGNIRELSAANHTYPDSNQQQYGIEDPAQSYNALTVGGYTELALPRSEQYQGFTPVAPVGGLSPMSRTSMMWSAQEWPFKPDIVMEAGNYVRNTNGDLDLCEDLQLLTTTVDPTGRLLDTIADTSAATAQAAKLSAELMAAYPNLWPETIRGLMVHSAEWTDQMMAEFPGQQRDTVHNRLRCYGYGVPDVNRAAWSVDNNVSLVAQDTLQPFQKTGSEYKTKDYHLHDFPWPKQVLEGLGEVPITIRITLSYFIEPSPARRGWTSKFRYASHGLRFALRGPVESDEDFLKRISKQAWSEEEKKKKDERTVDRPSTGEKQPWTIGQKVRTRGSIHSDWWTGTAAQAASCGQLAVYPVTGWWKERPHLNRYSRQARYALLVSISTPDESIDLYTPIANQMGITIST